MEAEVKLENAASVSQTSMKTKVENCYDYADEKAFVVKEEIIMDSVLDYELTSLTEQNETEDETSSTSVYQDTSVKQERSTPVFRPNTSEAMSQGDDDFKPFAFIDCGHFSDDDASTNIISVERELSLKTEESKHQEMPEARLTAVALLRQRNDGPITVLSQHIKDEPVCSEDSRNKALQSTVRRGTSEGAIRNNQGIQQGIKPHSCSQCNQSFTCKSSLNSHLLIHSGVKPYSCSQCNKSFTRKSSLNSHLLTHSGVKPYSCSQCGKSFTDKSNLRSHLLIHSGVKPYICSQCQKSFSQKSKLNYHILTHSDVKPYNCSQCHKSFANEPMLNRHILSHSNIKPYNCRQCHRSFSNKSSLKSHLIIHSDVKPYNCSQCYMPFARKSQLKIHLLTHSGIKPYNCSQCQVSFAKKSCLNRHLVTHCVGTQYICNCQVVW